MQLDRVLTPYEASFMGMRFFDDLPQHGIARRLGTYQVSVSRTLRKSLDKLEGELAE